VYRDIELGKQEVNDTEIRSCYDSFAIVDPIQGLFYLTTPLVSNSRVVEHIFLFNNLPKRKIVI
jgi:hypothetical protein